MERPALGFLWNYKHKDNMYLELWETFIHNDEEETPGSG